MRSADRIRAACALFAALSPLAAAAEPVGAKSAESPAPEVAAVVKLLAEASETTDPLRVAGALDRLRAAGPQAAPAAEAVIRLLSYRHPLYRDRDKLLVVRLRAYAFATLADLGPPPPSALPALVDVLVHADEQSPVSELAGASRAAAALGPRGRFFVPYLIEAIPLRRSHEEISLERFAADFLAAEATTVQLEAVRALAVVATPEDREALAVLDSLADHRDGPHDRRLVAAAAEAVARIRGEAEEPDPLPRPGELR